VTIDLTGGMDEARDEFRWDGEETFGMMERSIPVELLEG